MKWRIYITAVFLILSLLFLKTGYDWGFKDGEYHGHLHVLSYICETLKEPNTHIVYKEKVCQEIMRDKAVLFGD